jgi:hypothetical protein
VAKEYRVIKVTKAKPAVLANKAERVQTVTKEQQVNRVQREIPAIMERMASQG